MDQSKLPNEILALGDRLVHELGLSNSVDTAGRWMAHHLADLMIQARDPDASNHERARDEAAGLILKLWSRREVLPGNAYPLKELGKALSVLRLLEFESSPFSRSAQSQFDRLIAEAFDGLRKIIAHGILLTYVNPIEPVGDEVTSPFLTEEERRVVGALNDWTAHFSNARRSHVPRIIFSDGSAESNSEEEEKKSMPDEGRSKRAFISDIDALIAALGKLSDHVKSRP